MDSGFGDALVVDVAILFQCGTGVGIVAAVYAVFPLLTGVTSISKP